MPIEITDEMIYAFAGEPEITATDAHAIRTGLAAALALVAPRHCEGLDEGDWPEADCGNHTPHPAHERDSLRELNATLVAEVNRLGTDLASSRRVLGYVAAEHSPSNHSDEEGLCGGCGDRYPCRTRRILDGQPVTPDQREVTAGYTCPDHPGPLDDAEGHVCRLRPVQCLCGADLGPPWDTMPHRRGTPGCREADPVPHIARKTFRVTP